MRLIGTAVSLVIMVIEFIGLGIIDRPFKKKNQKDDEED